MKVCCLQFNFNIGDAVDKDLKKLISSMTSLSKAPFRILLNHMQLLVRPKRNFISVSFC